jgi:hypothetical membrane protein
MNITETQKSRSKNKSTISGILLFLAGLIIFMGIITGEIFHKPNFNTRDNYISELAAPMPPSTIIPQPSSIIFNTSIIVSGILIVIGSWLVQVSYKKLIVSIPLVLFGLGITGVGICPGYVIPWHGVFALIIFLTGGIVAISSYRIVHSPIKFIFIVLGIIALGFLFLQKFFIPSMGVGGAERWLFYPEVFWLMGFGSYLTGSNSDTK